MLLCAGLSLSSCVTTQGMADSYCQLYQQIVVQKGDGVIKAPPAVKKRILANEQIYRTVCKK